MLVRIYFFPFKLFLSFFDALKIISKNYGRAMNNEIHFKVKNMFGFNVYRCYIG